MPSSPYGAAPPPPGQQSPFAPSSPPQPPFGQPQAGERPDGPAGKKRTGLIVGLIAGGGCLLVLLLVVVLVIVLAVRGGAGGGGEETGSEVAQLTPEEQATQLVTDYMAALEAGDSAVAMELMPAGEDSDAEYLPAEVYDAGLTAAPVTDVVIGDPLIDESGISGTVDVDYAVGGESTSAEFRVADYDSDDVLALTSFSWYTELPEMYAGLGTTLNGTEVADGTVFHLLPGAYELGYSNENFLPASTDPVLAVNPQEYPEWPDAALSEDGLTTFRGAVQTAVDECVAQKTLEAGCGMDAVPESSSDGWTMVEDTVSRTLPEESQRNIDTMEGTPEYDEPTYVRGESVGTVDTTIECTKDGQTGTCELFFGGAISVPSVDMADPELPVTWS
ncbi:hypothetical protein [Brachybacterium sp. YJGR34]|uniref:hypothetical protein n=1 Tax=Brachybacterium sp. YJGR34 TaxID=2059911 RepID=UPI00130078E0|nr:hypothetical protein [Brachybacterium sp. YJGR34]